MVRVHARAHLDLLLLAAVRNEPGDGEAVMQELRRQSGGRFMPGARTIYSALHRLERNRLIRRSGGDARAYVLTVSGRRSLATKAQEWESFVQGVRGLIPPPG